MILKFPLVERDRNVSTIIAAPEFINIDTLSNFSATTLGLTESALWEYLW